MKLLFIVAIAFALMLGIVKRSKAFSLISSILIGSILWIFIRSIALGLWSNLSGTEQFCVIVLGLPTLLFGLVLSTTFGREVAASFFGDALFTLFRGVVLLPFRLLRALIGRRQQ
jgi:hypothetical protein